MSDQGSDAGSVATNIEWIKKSLAKIESEMDGKYVTQDQFEPIKKVVYGLVGLVLFMVGAAVIGFVVIQSGKNSLPH